MIHNRLFAECEDLDNFRGLCGSRTRTSPRTRTKTAPRIRQGQRLVNWSSSRRSTKTRTFLEDNNTASRVLVKSRADRSLWCLSCYRNSERWVADYAVCRSIRFCFCRSTRKCCSLQNVENRMTILTLAYVLIQAGGPSQMYRLQYRQVGGFSPNFQSLQYAGIISLKMFLP